WAIYCPRCFNFSGSLKGLLNCHYEVCENELWQSPNHKENTLNKGITTVLTSLRLRNDAFFQGFRLPERIKIIIVII
ncbi:MAG: hypothetical protein IKN18_04685, partial [Neisseriaceae bacterium]|nr:hypothetical protein [Neisseriaceae bacterium]